MNREERCPRRLLAAAGLLALGCSDGGSSARVGEVADRSDEVDRLRSLGYAGFAEEESKDRSGGTVHLDSRRVEPGYNLGTICREARVDLYDMQGRMLHSWSDPRGYYWEHAELMPDGDLMLVGTDLEDKVTAEPLRPGYFLARLDFDGRVEWRLENNAHHDVQPLGDGNWIVLTAVRRALPEIDPGCDTIDNRLVVVSPDGQVLAEDSLYDILAKPESHYEFGTVKRMAKHPLVDLFHTNSIESLHTRPELFGKHPLLGPDVLLLSMRNQDAVVAVDWKERKVVWWWGRGEISGAHDSRVLDDGHVLIFDNGLSRGWSRVIEVDPWTGEIVWDYHTEDREDFYSIGRGSSQRLGNGNTLIANSCSGQVFEVTPQGERVWEWLVPYFNRFGNRAEVYRVRRLPAEFVDPILAARGASPTSEGQRK